MIKSADLEWRITRLGRTVPSCFAGYYATPQKDPKRGRKTLRLPYWGGGGTEQSIPPHAVKCWDDMKNCKLSTYCISVLTAP